MAQSLGKGARRVPIVVFDFRGRYRRSSPSVWRSSFANLGRVAILVFLLLACSLPAMPQNLVPLSLTFLSQTAGTASGPQVVTLSNPGNSALNITSITITGTNATEFGETNNCNSSVAAGASCTVNVIFAPLAVGTRTGTLSIADSAPGSPQTVTLSGTGTANSNPNAGLWASDTAFFQGGDSGSAVLGYPLASLSSPSTAQPTGLIAEDGAAGLAFDSSGNLWMAFTQPGANTSQVLEYAASSLSTANPSLLAVISNGLSGPSFLAFDAAGNLWVTNYSGNNITEYSASSLALNPAPAATISASSLGFTCGVLHPTGLAFDVQGNLWVAIQGCTEVVKYAASTLTSNPTPVAQFAFNTVNNLLEGVAFDPSGNFWFGNNDRVLMIKASRLSMTGECLQCQPDATITNGIAAPTGSVGVFGLAFDAAGNLWVAENSGLAGGTNFPILEYPGSSLLSNPVPFDADNINNPAGLAFWPIPNAVSVPALLLSPASLDLGSQTVGTTSPEQTVTLTNNTSSAVSISGISITGTDASDFAQTNNCGSSVAANSNCAINVTFTPSVTGTLSASLNVADSAGTQSASLTGTGSNSGPTITMSPTGLTFSSQTVGTSSAPQAVTLSNTGNAVLSITSIGITGTNAADFGQTNDCGSSVAASARCAINVTFMPQASGIRTAMLSVSDNAQGSPQTIALSGTGSGGTPAVTLSPTSLTYASQLVGSTSTAQSVTVKNTGTGAMSISGISVGGANSSDFSQTNTCGTSVAAGTNCQVNVTFAPTATGTRTATLSISDNASGSPQTVSLGGAGTDLSLVAASGGSTSATITAGQTATYNLQLSPASGFTGSVSLSCSGAPTDATCSLSPSTLNVTGNTAVPFTLSVTTMARSFLPPSYPREGDPRRMIELLGVLLPAFVVLLLSVKSGRLKLKQVFVMAPAFALLLFLSACAGGNSSSTGVTGTPAGAYTVVVNAKAQGATRSLNLTLTVQ